MSAVLRTSDQPPPAASTTEQQGILLPCPACGERQATFHLDLAAGHHENGFQCAECEAEFTADELYERVQEMAARWLPVLDWVSSMPQFPVQE